MNNQPDFEKSLQERFDNLKPVPARNPQVAARARARFLAQAVAASETKHRKGWSFSFRRQQFALNFAVSLLVIAGLLFSGGTTVKAAQDDLPNEPLYGIKTWSEDISLQFESDPEAKVDRLMELAETRIQEMDQLVKASQPLPDQVGQRFEQHLQQALQLCSTMDDTALDKNLTQVREQLQQYEGDMQRLESHAATAEQPALGRTRTMLQTKLQLVDIGLVNHKAFRDTVMNGLGPEAEQSLATPVALPTETPKVNQGQNGQATSGPGNQNNGNGLGPDTNPSGQNAHVTPTPKNENNGVNSGNNPGNNPDDKDKDKDKGPKENDPDNNGNGKGPK